MTRCSLLFVLALAAQAEDPALFPAETGYRWTYQSKSRLRNVILGTQQEWKAGPKRTVEAVSAEQKGTDGRVFVFETTAEGAKATRETLLRTPRGVFANADSEDYPLIKFPPKQGDRWHDGFVNLGTEVIKVPAGTFTCWKISEQHWLPLGSNSHTRWYAKDVGIVKELLFSELEGGGHEEHFELEKFEKDPAKK